MCLIGEGKFLGSKCIAVMGELIAIGKPKLVSWARLNATAYAGQKTVKVRSQVLWHVGDQVVVSPTGYFGAGDKLWSDVGGGAELHTITAVSVNTAGSVITLNSPLNQTHLCAVVEGESFCGAVGVLSRSVKISARDSESFGTSNFGFGGHIAVIDLVPALDSVSDAFSGILTLKSVELTHLGKLNSDHYTISFSYSALHQSSEITDCSFNQGYSMAVRASNTANLLVRGNVAMSITEGGVYIEQTCTNFTVAHNLMVGLNQLSSVMSSSYPWVRSVAAFTILSTSGTVHSNLAAGSYDQGFSVATGVFVHPSGSNACSLTRGLTYTYTLGTLLRNRIFWDNEAVGCRGGLFVLTLAHSEVNARSCAVISGMKAWRNAHSGIMAVDAEANLLVANAVLAENHIGMSLNYYRIAEDSFTGVVASKIIGSLKTGGSCSDGSDVSWSQPCSVFSTYDPLGQWGWCGSVISGMYKRVGIMLPQFLNAPKTCATAGRFAVCDPPNTPDRLCGMPWEQRFGLPVDNMYNELHIHDTVFSGFKNSSCGSSQSPAIAINPTQRDEQATLVTSGLIWSGTVSKLAFNGGSSCGNSQPCMGHNMVMINDLDGSMLGSGTGGQILYNNPEYAAPYPLCTTAAELGLSFVSCPNTRLDGSSGAPFKQYSMHWRDYSVQNMGPIIVSRHFPRENRTYSSYGNFNRPYLWQYY